MRVDLEGNEDWCRTLVEVAPDAILVVDPRNTIVLVNARTEEVFGYERSGLLGRPVELLLPAGVHGPRIGRRADGTEFPVDVSLAPFETPGGIHIAATVRDDSERRAYELKDEFLAILSHELRTPLTAISGFASLLQANPEGVSNLTAADLAERIAINAAQMTTMIEQLLDFSRLEAGRVEPQLEPLDVSSVITRCIDGIGPTLQTHPVSVHCSANVRAIGDEDHLLHVLANLVGNAAKFSPPEAPISVNVAATGRNVVINVVDEGAGIPEAEQLRLFEPFYQASTRSGGRRGTGLGLAIARSYAELQGGQVSVRSVPGEGSTFTVTLERAGT